MSATLRNVGVSAEFIDVILVFEAVAGRLIGVSLCSPAPIEAGNEMTLELELDRVPGAFVGLRWGQGSGRLFVIERATTERGADLLVAPLPLWTLPAFCEDLAA